MRRVSDCTRVSVEFASRFLGRSDRLGRDCLAMRLENFAIEVETASSFRIQAHRIRLYNRDIRRVEF